MAAAAPAGAAKKPGVSAGVEVFGDHSIGILHRHVIAGEGRHAGVERAVQSLHVERAFLRGVAEELFFVRRRFTLATLAPA